METSPKNDFTGILKTLLEYRVNFIVVGGVAATLHGTPVTTFDLDIVHRRTSKNLERLERALNDLEARYRGDPRDLRPDRETLASSGHHLLITRMGPLDVLGVIEKGSDYEILEPQSVVIEFDPGMLRVLTLEALISLKETSGHEKDVQRLPALRKTLREREGNGSTENGGAS